ncbi:MAG: OmpA family protein [Reyranella sp.]|uniref:OmpA family protein n=1 Tax=Reyranella sp. TaxID=1929291 RepID=UPI001AD1725A|nr:OmpA family protein [Reyranella sp.]MBN9540407.1 OmpA family protein [Alphaproteobacteria bacterium]MBR2813843.1 OmpA family protein [Reyranella sp.]
MKKTLLAAAAALLALPAAANAQSSLFSSNPTNPGLYVGAQGGLNWLLNNNSYQMNTGWTAGGVVGYDFVGPRVELEAMYRSNFGTGTVAFPNGYANIYGQVQQVSVMANLLYDFLPGATITPYVGAGAGIAFVDSSIQGCSLCSTQFAYQGIIGIGWNVNENLRVNLDGRYYGTTNPGQYNNNNITTMLGVTYKFAQPAPAPVAPPPAAVQPPSFMVFFDWDRSNLTAQALGTIKQAAQAYQQKGNARITATGHTDTSGSEQYNMALSLRRANAVKDALVREGVPATAISVIGRGQQGLLVQTGPNVREPQNRRVEIVVQ